MPDPVERAAAGKAARSTARRSSHAGWEPPPGRDDPVAVLERQARSRVPDLVPIRYGRMAASPFAFFRGAAAVWKRSVEVERLTPVGMEVYAGLCGWTLARARARARARSGDRIAIAAYLGGGDSFDQAVSSFAGAYAEQNLRDHAALLDAIEQGRVVAEEDA